MRHICTSIGIGVTNSKDTSFAGAHSAGNIDLVAGHVQAHLGRQRRVLRSGNVDNKRIALDRFASSEVHAELVILGVLSIAAVLAAVLKALNRGNGAIVDLGAPSLELLLPVRDLGCGTSFAFGGLSAVDKGNHVAVQSVHL